MTDSSEAKHIDSLDGLRGIAIILVLTAHVFPLKSLSESGFQAAAAFLSIGNTGVHLFFVLSGFLITSILIRNKSATNYFRAFYARRVLRIVPLYYLLLFLFLIIIPRDDNNWINHDGNTIYYWLFLNNFYSELGVPLHRALTVCWSLAVEEQYYLIWPLIVRGFKNNILLFIAASCFLGSIGLRAFLYLHAGYSGEHVHVFTPAILDGIALGSMIALLFASESNIAAWILSLLGKAFPLLLLLVCAVWSVAARQNTDLGMAFYEPLLVVYGWAISTIMYASVLVIAVKNKSKINAFLRLGILRKFGKYSYAIYLFHVLLAAVFAPVAIMFQYFIMLFLKHVGIEVAYNTLSLEIFGFFIKIVMIYYAGKLSWELLESRVLSLKSHFPFKE